MNDAQFYVSVDPASHEMDVSAAMVVRRNTDGSFIILDERPTNSALALKRMLIALEMRRHLLS